MVKEKLVDYVETNLIEGHPLKQITSALVKTGVPQKDIDDAVDLATGRKKATKRSNAGWIISAIVFLIALGLAIYFLLAG